MAIDAKGGISKGASMPWPRNSLDLKWFKKHTENNVVIIGRKTWEDPFMPTPLKSRINVLVTKKSNSLFPGADHYLSENIEHPSAVFFGIDEQEARENNKINKNLFFITLSTFFFP